MMPSVGNANQVPQNQNTSATQTTEHQIPVDIPDTSQQQPGIAPPIEQYSREGIREKVPRRVHLAREHEIQRQVNLILERDRLVCEEKERVDEEAVHAE
ncbi:hypothetical protein LIER_27748 [Lithospermum erythrorhizon]|uniref:Uncharacterized protein n=1 Tax=Lithospermum erythrorhizon TaxID=34254 RepID=A0AAV3RD53_LITER